MNLYRKIKPSDRMPDNKKREKYFVELKGGNKQVIVYPPLTSPSLWDYVEYWLEEEL